MNKLARKIALRKVLTTFQRTYSLSRDKTASLDEVSDFFSERYEDLIEALITDDEAIVDFIEDAVNLGRLEVENGHLFYRGRRIL